MPETTCQKKIAKDQKCGRPVVFSNEDRCEDCWADDQWRWSGRSQRVKVIETNERKA